MQALNLNLINKAYDACNVRWYTDPKNNGKRLKDGSIVGVDRFTCDSVETGRKRWARFTVAQFEAFAALNVDAQQFIDDVSVTGNVKTAMRMPQLVEFIVTGNPRALSGSALVAVVQALSIDCDAKNRDALRFAATGRGDEFTSDVIDVSKARALTRALGGQTVSASSEATMNSVSFAQGNLLGILGIAHKGGRNDFPSLNRDSALYRAIAKHVNRISERDLIALAAETEAKPKRTRAKKGA